jgi:hypothetical protein
MPTNTPLSARVRTVSQERVDKIDFDLLQELVDQGVRRQMGNLLGYAQGVASPFLTTYDPALFTLTFGKFAYCGTEMIPESQDAGTTNPKSWRGGFYVFNPNDESQTATWSIAAARAAAAAGNAGAAYPYILVKPDQVQTKTEARIQWSGGAEVPVSVQTQLGIRHIFSFSTTYPSVTATDGYSVVGKITAWSAFGNANPGTPTITPISMWDNLRLDAEVGTAVDSSASGAGISIQPILRTAADPTLAIPGFIGSGATGPADVGLVKVLGFIRGQIARIMDSDPTDGWQWWADPANSAGSSNPINGGLSQVWVKLTELWYDYSTLTTVRPWASARFTYDQVTQQYSILTAGAVGGSARNVSSITRIADGNIEVVLSNSLPTGWKYNHVLVTTRGAGPWDSLTLMEFNNVLLSNVANVWRAGVSLRRLTVASNPVPGTPGGLAHFDSMEPSNQAGSQWVPAKYARLGYFDADFTLTAFITKDV